MLLGVFRQKPEIVENIRKLVKSAINNEYRMVVKARNIGEDIESSSSDESQNHEEGESRHVGYENMFQDYFSEFMAEAGNEDEEEEEMLVKAREEPESPKYISHQKVTTHTEEQKTGELEHKIHAIPPPKEVYETPKVIPAGQIGEGEGPPGMLGLLSKKELREKANIDIQEKYGILPKRDTYKEPEVVKEDAPPLKNWLKEIVETHMKQLEMGENLNIVLNEMLNLLLSTQSSEIIQNDLLELLGFENIEMISGLIEHRPEIMEYCGYIKKGLKSLQSEGKGRKHRKKHRQHQDIGSTAQRESTQPLTNLDLLKNLGFSEEYVSENRFLGLKEKSTVIDPKVMQSMAATQNTNFHVNEYVGTKVLQQINKEGEVETQGECITKEVREYSKITFPAIEKDLHLEIPRVPLELFPDWCGPAFQDIQELNPVQSAVYETAFHTTNNMLICAPTSSGKTMIAVMAMLKEISNYRPMEGHMAKRFFKIIYVAPMKALAAEIVEKLKKKIGHLGIKVRELTGDMQLTRTEIIASHVLVVTPEKLDVMTRKTDNIIMSMMKLLIIDEIHLLGESRGAVLESLVVRAFMTIQRTQNPLRIIGLSATLPNYRDIARFLKAENGTYYFDHTFRPTPLTKEFYGVKEKGNGLRTRNIYDDICYEAIYRTLTKGKQAIVFVHSRNETINLAERISDKIKERQHYGLFLTKQSDPTMARDVARSPNKHVTQLFDSGLGIHNAGMLRRDRTLSEKLFLGGHIKVLFSTATLAWGINMPAYCVIINGTQYYDPQKGGFADIGILDIQQIFGRAGRPQYDSEGEAVIITDHDKMNHYIALLTNQTNIESSLLDHLEDAINAEISNGTITSISEGAMWLKYTYLSQRINQNPKNYGSSWEDVHADIENIGLFTYFMMEVALKLKRVKMVKYVEEYE